MRSARSLVGAALLVAALAPARRLQAQSMEAYLRAQDLETHEQYEAAAAAYREAIAESPTLLPAILGLERVYAQLGRSDSLLPILERAIAAQPRQAAFRAAQLRTLRLLGDQDRLRAAFERWRRDVPHDPAPYREYARMLIQDGFTAAADTVLREAQAAVGSGRGFEYELAQLHAAMGLWESSAGAWRRAVADNPFLVDAATYSLLPTPDRTRDAVRRALAAPPPSVAVLRVVASLDITWGNPRAGWDVLRTLTPDSAGVAAWLDFARRAEEAEAWLAARDALTATLAAQPSAALAARAASDALNGGDAAGAATLAARAERALDSTTAAGSVVPVHLRALSLLGKPQDADRLLAAYEPYLPPDQRARLARTLAWGWVRIGNLEKAKALLAQSGATDSDPAEGWLALYQGDLAGARERLSASPDAPPELLMALELLERTSATRAPDVGEGFLALARGDTGAAVAAFERAAKSVPDAASLLIATAARLESARGATQHAATLWQSIVEQSPTAPEAPEAELEWARSLRRDGRLDAAIQRLEHLILTYPESALVPQARRELELARRAVPPNS
jgi:tetratricopeptide (TPR) repeat protein